MRGFLNNRFANRWLWLCPFLSIVLAAAVLMLFGFSFWSALLAALPKLKQRDLAQLLPHNWRPAWHAVTADSAPVAAAALRPTQHTAIADARVSFAEPYNLSTWTTTL